MTKTATRILVTIAVLTIVVATGTACTLLFGETAGDLAAVYLGIPAVLGLIGVYAS